MFPSKRSIIIWKSFIENRNLAVCLTSGSPSDGVSHRHLTSTRSERSAWTESTERTELLSARASTGDCVESAVYCVG